MQQGQALADSFGIPFLESSAKARINVVSPHRGKYLWGKGGESNVEALLSSLLVCVCMCVFVFMRFLWVCGCVCVCVV